MSSFASPVRKGEIKQKSFTDELSSLFFTEQTAQYTEGFESLQQTLAKTGKKNKSLENFSSVNRQRGGDDLTPRESLLQNELSQR